MNQQNTTKIFRGEETLNGAPMPLEKIEKYLARIEIEYPQKPDLSYLSRLQMAHASHIPYENLDIMDGKPLSLDRETLYTKMIENRRGGVCSEINTLYNWLLESLGFSPVSYSSRIITKNGIIQPPVHRIMAIRLDEKIYITDAGFNSEHHRIPLLLEENIIQDDGECQYKLVRDDFYGWILWQKRAVQGWVRKIGFTRQTHVDADFVPATFYSEKHPDSRINKAVKVSQYIDGVFHAVRFGQFSLEHGGNEEVIEEITSPLRERQIIREVFHL